MKEKKEPRGRDTPTCYITQYPKEFVCLFVCLQDQEILQQPQGRRENFSSGGHKSKDCVAKAHNLVKTL